MRLAALSVSRFRSILEATRVEFRDFTVLIGRNNEGKSNFLRSLEISFGALRELGAQSRTGNFYRRRSGGYDWDRDFPLSIRNREKGRRDTTIRLSFELNENELDAFYESFNIRLSTNLTLEVVIGESNAPRIRWVKQGQSSIKVESQTNNICEFIVSRFTFSYIPAVRTERDSAQIISDLVNQKLIYTIRSKEYQEAQAKLKELEKPVLDQIGKDILGTLQPFLPSVKSLRFERGERLNESRLMRGDLSIFVDDGNDTNLAFKGDGIKSMVALALFKHGLPLSGSAFLAIEEPEAHLHSGAIHELRLVLKQIAQNAQVMISTHSHAFVSRELPRDNIIVHEGRVREAQSIAEVRNILGIRASDNLVNSDLILVVEGRTDEILLKKLLSDASTKISGAIRAQTISFDVLGGAGRLAHRAGSLRREIFSFLVIMDNDQAGRQAVKDALESQCLDPSDYKMINVIGMSESEIEDLIDPSIYGPFLRDKYEVNLTRNSLPGRGKWTDRMRDLFHSQGKLWDDDIKSDLKESIARIVAAHDGTALISNRGAVLQTIVEAVEFRLGFMR